MNRRRTKEPCSLFIKLVKSHDNVGPAQEELRHRGTGIQRGITVQHLRDR